MAGEGGLGQRRLWLIFASKEGASLPLFGLEQDRTKRCCATASAAAAAAAATAVCVVVFPRVVCCHVQRAASSMPRRGWSASSTSVAHLPPARGPVQRVFFLSCIYISCSFFYLLRTASVACFSLTPLLCLLFLVAGGCRGCPCLLVFHWQH